MKSRAMNCQLSHFHRSAVFTSMVNCSSQTPRYSIGGCQSHNLPSSPEMLGGKHWHPYLVQTQKLSKLDSVGEPRLYPCWKVSQRPQWVSLIHATYHDLVTFSLISCGSASTTKLACFASFIHSPCVKSGGRTTPSLCQSAVVMCGGEMERTFNGPFLARSFSLEPICNSQLSSYV